MPTWDSVASALRNPQTADELEAMEFCFDSPRIHNTVKLAGYARAAFPPECSIQDAVVDLTRRIHADFEYDPRATTVTTPMAEVMSRRKGVCQDFAHLEIGMLRSLGLAARYVSGYVRTHPPEGQRCLVGADASHAWLSVYCGEAGWIDVDPTNNCFAEADHIMVAWGRDYSDVTPLRGVYTGGGRHSLSVSVEVVVI